MTHLTQNVMVKSKHTTFAEVGSLIFNTQRETLSPAEKEALQSEQLHALLTRIDQKNRFYHDALQASHVTPNNIQTIADIRKLPLINANDLMLNFPYGLLTIPVSGIVRFQQSAPAKATGLTQRDLANQTEMLARCLIAGNVTLASVVMILPAGLDPANVLSLQQTAETLGATVITGFTINAKDQLKTMLEFGVTTLFAAPSTLIELAQVLHHLGFSTHDLPVIQLWCEARQLTPEQRTNLAAHYTVPVYALYGHSDIMPLGIAGECHLKQGLHIHEDHFYAEIIDRDTQEVLMDGQPGELVLTTLSREGMPLIRYRTGDMAVLDHTPCPCGRTSARLHCLHL
ncbi:phenylacetate--CoA ligase family protein [Propionispora sp. 2/2-37]|uniref:phenylacetate--CoA ligase family protein n=1 Tax=Propionispora sp. 2/2-37 TaxID=1677858 RepID=UPI001F2DAEB4|nr:phenylacetate--CoA ligase family protein [Propionispora sp. 2/2-37]